MTKIRIPAMDIARRHPLFLKGTTDAAYARFASDLAELMEKLNIQEFKGDNLRELAIVLTMYYEDMISDLGIWNALTDTFQELYGRQLPFYDVDMQHYYRNEPNVEDIRFLIWLLMTRTEPSAVVSPDTPALEAAARTACSLMDKRFEDMPVNEELKEFFEKAEFAENFYAQLDLMKWSFYACYASCNENAPMLIRQQAQRLSQSLNCPPPIAMNVAESIAMFESRLQPLAMRPQDWLARIVRNNGNAEAADKIASQRYLPFDFYRIVDSKKGESMTFESLRGDKFTLTDRTMSHPQTECYDSKSAMAFFVEYGGEFYLGSQASWSNNTEAFDAEKAQRKHNTTLCLEKRSKLIEQNSGSPLFYFNNADMLRLFLIESVGLSKRAVSQLTLPQDEVDFTVFVRESDFNVVYFPNVARLICDPRNPLYDAEYAKAHTFGNIFMLPGDMLRYLNAHDMLPEARINCFGGEEEGRKVVKENFDFFARMMQGSAY